MYAGGIPEDDFPIAPFLPLFHVIIVIGMHFGVLDC